MLRPLARALRELDHVVTLAPLGLNLGCGEDATATVAACVAEADQDGVVLVGHSRGGQLARVVAVRHPELVERLVTVATPWTVGPPRQPGIHLVASALRATRRIGIDPVPSIDCASGECCARFRAEVAQKPAARWVALWSRRDRIAGEDGRPPQSADAVVETGLGHVSTITSGRGISLILGALAS
jgi:pimeloyl-ACP methyl ester carboxylesterase